LYVEAELFLLAPDIFEIENTYDVDDE